MSKVIVTNESIESCQILMKEILQTLRMEKSDRSNGAGARELSLAITHLETGCMWLVRSKYVLGDQDYDPTKDLKKE
jgi:hypothetical protein